MKGNNGSKEIKENIKSDDDYETKMVR